MSGTMQVKFSEDENFNVEFENVGRDGKDGGYYFPSVDSAGNLSFKASKENMPTVPVANIRGPQGVSIVSILRTEGDGSPGTVDTYTITYSDGKTTTYTVVNGANGVNGKDAYKGAKEHGYVGTEEQFYTDLALMEQRAQAAVNAGNAAGAFASAAEQSAANAAKSATNAGNAESGAKTAEQNAKNSETAAKTAQQGAESAKDSAKTSETNAKTSETNAAKSETNAKTSETNASDSANKAATSEANAKNSESAAKVSETNAKTSEGNAKTSETNAASSQTAAQAAQAAAEKARDEAQAIAGGDFLSKSGGDMTGAINSTYGKSINALGTDNRTWHDAYTTRIRGGTGAICIDIGDPICVVDFDLIVAADPKELTLSISGYSNTGSTNWKPRVYGFKKPAELKVRSALSPENHKCILIGDSTTSWGSFTFVDIPRFSSKWTSLALDWPSLISVSLLADETGYTIGDVSGDIGVSVTDMNTAIAGAAIDPNKLTEPVPIEKGGTGAASAADARTNLDVYSKAETVSNIAVNALKIHRVFRYCNAPGWYRIGRFKLNDTNDMYPTSASPMSEIVRFYVHGNVNNGPPYPFMIDAYLLWNSGGYLRQYPAYHDPYAVTQFRICSVSDTYFEFDVDVYYPHSVGNDVRIGIEPISSSFTSYGLEPVVEETGRVTFTLTLTKDGFLTDRPTTTEMNTAISDAIGTALEASY